MISPIPRFTMYQDVPKKFIPILWMEKKIEADKGFYWKLRLALSAPKIGQILGILLIFTGVVLITQYLLNRRRKSNKMAQISTGINGTSQNTQQSTLQPLITKE